MTTIEIRDRGLFKAVISAGYEVLSREACLMDNRVQIKRLEDLAEDLRRQLAQPREEDRRGSVPGGEYPTGYDA